MQVEKWFDQDEAMWLQEHHPHLCQDIEARPLETGIIFDARRIIDEEYAKKNSMPAPGNA